MEPWKYRKLLHQGKNEKNGIAEAIPFLSCPTMFSYREAPLDIPVFVVSQEELEDILKNAPEWWGDSNKEIYDNLIFMFPNISYDSFYNEVGNPKEEYEKIYHYKNVIFWSFSRKDYQKTNWWSKTASSKISDRITIRTANTVRKIVKM